MNVSGASESVSKAKSFFGHSGPSIWRANMEIGNPITDGLSGLSFYKLDYTSRS